MRKLDHVENRHQKNSWLVLLMSKHHCTPILINKLSNPVSSGGEDGYGAFLEPKSWITTEPKSQTAGGHTVTAGKNSTAACHKELNKQDLRTCLRGIDYFYFTRDMLHLET